MKLESGIKSGIILAPSVNCQQQLNKYKQNKIYIFLIKFLKTIDWIPKNG